MMQFSRKTPGWDGVCFVVYRSRWSGRIREALSYQEQSTSLFLFRPGVSYPEAFLKLTLVSVEIYTSHYFPGSLSTYTSVCLHLLFLYLTLIATTPQLLLPPPPWYPLSLLLPLNSPSPLILEVNLRCGETHVNPLFAGR